MRALSAAILFTSTACSTIASQARWPGPVERVPTDDSQSALGDSDADWIERQPVCVSSRHWSAGTLGETVLYRSHRVGRRVNVGYFVYWSTERPWGANFQSYTLLPALATDAFYSHFLAVLPGAKDLIYGPADIEGALVEYEQMPDGSLRVLGGRADDAQHEPVELSSTELMDARGRIVLLTDVWSHQLGAHGAAEFFATPEHTERCYQGSTLRPITEQIAQAFRMGNEREPRRATPAWRDSAPSSKPPVQVASVRR